MKRSIVVFVSVLGLLTAACGADNGPEAPGADEGAFSASPAVVRAAVVPSAPVAELAAGMNDAGFDLLRTQGLDGNHVLSPSSIGHAALMIRGAADGPTTTAINQRFSLPSGDAADEAWNTIELAIAESNDTQTGWDGGPSPLVRTVDRVWPRTGSAPDQTWIDSLARFHGADVEPIDVSDAEASTARINEWVSDQTEGLIPDLLPAGFIDGSTLLVLTDAIYFEADWALPFQKYGAEIRPFTLLDGSIVDVTLMRELEGLGAHGAGDGYVGAELPYLGDEYSMLVIVPDEGRFDDVLARLDTDLLAEIDSTFGSGPFELMIPKWETNSTIDLMAWLSEAQVAPGNFPGIAEGSFLDGAVHGADIAVDEWGTIAAAATAFGVAESGPPEPDLRVIADRPFLYVIRHVDSGLALFAGQITNPLA